MSNPSIPDPAYRQSVKNWLAAFAALDPDDHRLILETVGVLVLLLSTRSPRGEAPSLTDELFAHRSKLWKEALRDVFEEEEDDEGGAS